MLFMQDLNQSTPDLRPTLTTERLVLRPFQLGDATAVQHLAGHALVAATTATIPHPYPDGTAEAWITMHRKWFQLGQVAPFAITLKASHALIGCIDLAITAAHARAELGYWIGVDYWNHGYCSEAAKSVVEYGFRELRLNKITSHHLSTNPASGQVMIKAGMMKEGLLRKHFIKNGVPQDLEVYGLLREELR
jgi:ribosomal-protein-alanine N-acetyltransferase